MFNFFSNRLGQCVKGMLAFAIYITHGLACYVAIDITYNDYVSKKLGPQRKKIFWEYFVRTCLVLVTCEYSNNKTKLNYILFICSSSCRCNS